LSAYDEDDGKEVEIIHSTNNANWTKNPPGFRYEDLEFRNVFDYYYKGEDIEKFLSSLPNAKIEAQKESTQTKQTTNDIKDDEIFIRSLSISYVSDTEISIKVGNKKAENYTCGDMGFKSSENGWKLLMEVLHDRYHLFDAGTYSKDKIPEKNKRYNQRQKWITQFTKKFITFINREHGTQIPDKTKLFENQKNKNRDGLYKPIFQVASNDAINSTDVKKMSKQAVLKKIETLASDRKGEKNAEEQHRLLSDIGVYAQHAKKKGWITEEYLRSLISLPDEEVSPDDALSCSEESNNANDF
jgi:hypothetical protein